MTINRRSFIRTSVAVGAGLMIPSLPAFPMKKNAESALFGVHPFIHDNPNAVFIMKTDIDVKTNAVAMEQAGLAFGRSVLGLTNDPENGVPLSHIFNFKPNLTCRISWHKKYTVERSMGIVTDSFFMEGIIKSMKEIGISESQMFMREVNCPSDLKDSGYIDLAERTGVDIQGIDIPYSELEAEKIVWKDVPEGVYFNRIPYLWPINAPNSWLMNVSKLKAHSMGLTLCAKNLQGTIAMKYQAHCNRYGNHLDILDEDIRSDANYQILENYNRRVAEGVPRWDKPGSNGGIWQETWGTRCLDNNSVTEAGLHVIEGIYGRDGNFMDGPDAEGIATDYMCNYIVFGKNAFYVDIIGHWLGGHEPGNFGLFHMAKDRGFINNFNPSQIPLFDWDAEKGASAANIFDYERFPLVTKYLQKDYDGGNEPYWHLCNEKYDYTTVNIAAHKISETPFTLSENFPNPSDLKTSIPYEIKHPGHVLIEVFNSRGNIVDILVDTYLPGGKYMVNWKSSEYPDGLYLYRMCFEGKSQTKSIMLYH